MGILQVLCLLACCASAQSQEQTYLITAPKIFRVGAAENVVVQTFGYSSAFTVDISVKSYPDKTIQYDSKQLTLSPANQFQSKATLTIQPKDLPRKDAAHLYVYLEAKTNSFTKEEQVPITFENGFLFIQTDKPIYTPDQSVKVRVYSLDEELKPPRRKTTLTFVDPEGVKVDFMEADDFVGIVSFPDFKIPANPKFGIWTIKAAYTKDFTTTGIAQFEVKEYELPSLFIAIQPEASIIGYDKFEAFKITIKASYVYNKRVLSADAYVRFGILDGKLRKMLAKSILYAQIIDGVAEVIFNSKTAVKEIGYESLEDLDGFSLYITVSVLETPDSHPEESELATVKYLLSPYNLKLIATPLFIRPGLPFYIKVQVRDVLENPVKMMPVTLTATVLIKDQESTTLVHESSDEGKAVSGSQDGIATFSVNIPYDANTLDFTIRTADKKLPDGNQAVSSHNAIAYFSLSRSYLYIDWAAQYRTLHAGDFLNMNVYPSSHYLQKVNHFSYLILSKGKIVTYGSVKRFANSSYQSLNIQLTSEMVPSARLLVYYILTGDQTAELVADSVWINVQDKCVHSQQVELSTDAKTYAPGKGMKLTMKAQSGSYIALSSVDTAIYGVVRKSQRPLERVLRDFEKSDLGCGAGGGKNNADVFNLAGITFITNANAKAVAGQDQGCSELLRPKRQVSYNEELAKEVNSYKVKEVQDCCLEGIRNYLGSDTCEQRASRMTKRRFLQRCINAFKKCCDLANALRDQDAGKVLELARMQIRTLFDADEPQIRSYFPESWLWKTESLTDSSGSKTLPLTLPDSLTTWEIQGIGMSNRGLCVADPVTVQVFKDIFLNVHMPYSVVRGEQMELVASVYNHRNYRIRCCVKITVGDEICLFKGASTTVKGTQSTTCTPSYVQANSITVVKFKLLSLEAGLHSVNFTLNSDHGNEIVVKTLRVVQEGIKKEKLNGFTLDPQGSYGPMKRREAIRYMVPPNIVPKSKIDRTLSIKGRLFDDVISAVLNPESVKILTNLPKGSAETELMRVVPIFYVFHYLESTDNWQILGPLSLTSRTNMRRQMKEAMLSILSFRNKDKSYSMWKDREPSTWLTAFALRILGEVQKYVPLDQMDTCNTLIWLIEKCQLADGSFKEKSGQFPVKLQGTLPNEEKEKAIYMTAFVLIGMQKAYDICRTQQIQTAINRAEVFLMDQTEKAESTFTLAIGVYALTLTDRTKAATQRAVKALRREAFIKETSNQPEYRYWKETPKAINAANPNAGTARMVETTAYALLATLCYKDMAYANPIMRWLSNEQRYGGGFYSIQDTLNALEALAQYAIELKMLKLDMIVKVSYEKYGDFQRYELNKDQYFTKLVEVPLNDDLIISTGSGTGIASGHVRTVYNTISNSAEDCRFNLKIGQFKHTDKRSRRQTFEKPQNPDQIYLEACVKYKPNVTYGHLEAGQTVMEISLASGLEAVEEDLSLLATSVEQLISGYSLEEGRIVLHLDWIPSDEFLCVVFRARQIFKVGMLSPSTFRVYEFREPDKQCTIFYNPYGENELLKLCRGDECKCMEAECSQMQLKINLTITADTRKEKACQKDTVYAYKVSIVSSVEDGNFIKYTATLQDIFKIGEARLKIDNKVKFIKKKSCTDIILDVGKQYLIMGKEGFQIQVKFSFEYEYALDATTWLEWWPSKSDCDTKNCAQFVNVMNEFSEDILISGC